MEITLENIVALDKGIKKIYNDTFKDCPKNYLKQATVVETKNHSVDYAWLGDFPSMKEWVGDRDLKELTDHKYTISKKDWEASVTVYRDDLLFDNLGMVTPRVQNLANTVVEHYNSYIGTLITTNKNCYDGKAFFSKTHRIGQENVSNKSTLMLNSTNLMKVYSLMLNLKKENGNSFGIKPSKLYIAPNLLSVAMTIINSDVIGGSTNITKNLVEFEVMPDMHDNSWVLVDNTKPIKPFIIQITKKAKIEKSENDLFKSKKIHYGVDTMDNAGYTFWQLAHFSLGTVAP